MWIAILVNVLSIFFAFLEGKKILNYGLFISFLILFFFLALRYDFGNDYIHYYQGFEKINSYINFDIYDEDIHFEPGWVLLCKLFKPVGFFGLVMGLSFLYCYTFYKFIRKYLPSNLYWFAVFILVFYQGNMMIELSAMRQTLAIVIFVYALEFIQKKQIIRYMAFILLASTFHISILFFLPLYFIQYINFKLNRFVIGILFFMYLGCYLASDSLKPLVTNLIVSFNANYMVYDQAGVITSGFGLVLNSLIFLVILAQERDLDTHERLISKIVILGFLISPFSLVIMMISRLTMYTSVLLMVVYPFISKTIKTSQLKHLFIITILLMGLFSFFSLVYSPIFKDGFKEYHTIFEAI